MSAANPFLSAAHAEAYDLARPVSAAPDAAHGRLPRDLARRREGRGRRAARPQPRAKSRSTACTTCRASSRSCVAVPPRQRRRRLRAGSGLIAIVEKGKIAGWNVTIGGGMGMTHGETKTFPRTGRHAGLLHARAGGRRGREGRHRAARLGQPRADASARASSTPSRMRGLDAFRAEVERRLGYKLGAAAALHASTSDGGDPESAGKQRRRQKVAPDAVHRERPRQGQPGHRAAHGAARDCRVPAASISC